MSDEDALQWLVVDLSAFLADEADALTPEGVDAMRRRVANALPATRCPEWLAPYRVATPDQPETPTARIQTAPDNRDAAQATKLENAILAIIILSGITGVPWALWIR